MSDFWVEQKIKKSRKIHQCQHCRREIKIGESCVNEIGVYQGDFQSYYLCERCHVFIDKYMTGEDELGEFQEDIPETHLLNCPTCKERGYPADYDFSNDMMTCECECRNCGKTYTVDLSLEAIRDSKPSEAHS